MPCRCGCGTVIDHLRSDALYASEACSKRHRRAKTRIAAQRAASPDKARTRHPYINYRRRYLGIAGFDGPLHVVR